VITDGSITNSTIQLADKSLRVRGELTLRDVRLTSDHGAQHFHIILAKNATLTMMNIFTNNGPRITIEAKSVDQVNIVKVPELKK